ncbi:MAG: aminomethyltransferase family protein [Phycisphaerales bacterium]|nr:aminomethyltransferase family protein [Phycisphaerales bacterium]
MLHDTPLRNQHQQYLARSVAETGRAALASQAERPGAAGGQIAGIEVEYIAYGAGEPGAEQWAVPAAVGSVESEYASIRRGAGLMDCPQRGTLLVTGPERREFLNRMLTQELKGIEPGQAAESFWLNRTGRIDADLVVLDGEASTLLTVDRHQAAAAAASLQAFIIMEEVALEDVSDAWYHLAIHGPLALQVLACASGDDEVHIGPMAGGAITVAGVDCNVIHRDQCGVTGLDLLVPRDQVELVWSALVLSDAKVGENKRRVRPIGWYAYNIARIEAGTPLFNVDFGTSTLPHESGIVERRVSFTKGCYLGQEVVARMHSRGKAKQVLVAVRMEQDDALPVAGSQVYKDDDDTLATPVGVVTSSTISPMLGAIAIGFVMVRSAHAKAGTALRINIEGTPQRAIVQDGLDFLHATGGTES